MEVWEKVGEGEVREKVGEGRREGGGDSYQDADKKFGLKIRA